MVKPKIESTEGEPMPHKPECVIVVNGVEYVPKTAQTAADDSGKPYVLLRAVNAGVHAGYLASRDGGEAVLHRSRRIWSWAGAASLSQLAVDGPGKPAECRFAVELAQITVLGVIEVIPCTEKAHQAITGVKPWKQ